MELQFQVSQSVNVNMLHWAAITCGNRCYRARDLADGLDTTTPCVFATLIVMRRVAQQTARASSHADQLANLYTPELQPSRRRHELQMV